MARALLCERRSIVNSASFDLWEKRTDNLAMDRGPDGVYEPVHGAHMDWPPFWNGEVAPLLNTGAVKVAVAIFHSSRGGVQNSASDPQYKMAS